jgi:hypothetical protein
MRTIKGPGLFLAQFIGDAPPFDSLAAIAGWAADLGYAGLQLPTLDPRFLDLALAAESDAYCDEIKGLLAEHGLVITELSTHIQGQLVAVNPGMDGLLDRLAPPELRGSPAARTQWAIDQLHLAARASLRLGLTAHATFSGALLWPAVYPWPPRPASLVHEGFAELARRWRPILDAFDEAPADALEKRGQQQDVEDGIVRCEGPREPGERQPRRRQCGRQCQCPADTERRQQRARHEQRYRKSSECGSEHSAEQFAGAQRINPVEIGRFQMLRRRRPQCDGAGRGQQRQAHDHENPCPVGEGFKFRGRIG